MRALLLFGLLLTACAPPLMLEGAACPCTTGWTCCENVSICVREGTSCPTVPGPDVTPAKVELGQDRVQRFTTTTTDVTWAIEEGAAGGTIDQTGRYRAPNTVGEYHVLASAHGGTTRITITVRPLRLSVLAGTSGGASRLPVDGVGPLARLSEPKGLALVGRQLFFKDQNQLRRLDLATRRVDTLIGSTERRVPNTPGSFGYQRFTELSVSRAGTLLFHDETCTREYSVPRDTLDTFWCNESVRAMAGDETRLIRLGGTPSKLLVIDRATRQSVELPAPAEGFVGVVKLSLREDLLWLLDHSGTALRVWDLRQPTAPPRVVIAPSLGKVFVDLEADFTDYAPHGTSVTLLEAGGRLASWNIDGMSLGFKTAAGNQVLGFTVTGPEPIHGYYLLTPDTLRVSYSWTDELLAGKPARDRIEVDGIGGGAGLVVGDFGFATRGDVTWLGSPLSVRRIARDGTTTSIPTDLPADSITVDDHHLWLFNANALALRRIALSPGSTWQPVAYQPDERIALLGPMADGRIAFVERRKVRFLDPSTGELLPTAIPLPNMAIVSLDPSGALYGEVISLQSRTSQTPPMSTGLNGVQRLDFSTGQLTKAGPEPLLTQFTNSGIGSWLASATQERQYAVSTAGDQVFIDQNGAWVPLFAMEHREDDALMALSREHRQAFDTLVARHQLPLLRIAAKYLGDVSAAKDVCQSVFLEVYQARHRYQARGRFTHWLRRVLLTHCHLAARKGRLLERTRPEAGPSPSQPDEQILAEERRRLVEAHVAKLGEKHREVVVLRYAGEHPLEEIAEILEVPLGTVKSRLFAAMAALSDSMKEEAP